MEPRLERAGIRVTLRPVHPGDVHTLQRWRSEPSVRRHQPLADTSIGQLRAEMGQSRHEDLYRGRGEKFQWIIIADTEPAGWITLVVANWDHGLAEMGYALGTRHQRLGIMPHALQQLLADLFFSTPLRRIEARCSVENEASHKVLERVGFRREGLLREYFVLRGRRVDNYLFAILRDDFVP